MIKLLLTNYKGRLIIKASKKLIDKKTENIKEETSINNFSNKFSIISNQEENHMDHLNNFNRLQIIDKDGENNKDLLNSMIKNNKYQNK